MKPRPHIQVKTATGFVEGKTCTRCGRDLRLSCYSVSSNASDGLQSRCKQCQSRKFSNNVTSQSDFEQCSFNAPGRFVKGW